MSPPTTPPPDEPTTTDGNPWTAYQDDDDNTYYHNSITGETTWDKPGEEATGDDNNNDADADADAAGPTTPDHADQDTMTDTSAAIDDQQHEQQQGGSPQHENEYSTSPSQQQQQQLEEQEQNENDNNNGAGEEDMDNNIASAWVAYQDEEGREYYYNNITQATQWEKPDGFVEGVGGTNNDDDMAAITPDTNVVVVDHGNELMGTTTTQAEASLSNEAVTASAVADDDDDQINTNEERPTASPVAAALEESSEDEEGEINAEEISKEEREKQAIQTAVDKLAASDAMLEPECLTNVSELVSYLGGKEGGPKAMQALTDGYHGQTAICGILSVWLKELHGMTSSSSAAAKSSSNTTSSSSSSLLSSNNGAIEKAKDDKDAEYVRNLAEGVVMQIVNEKFTKQRGDDILNLSKAKAKFLQDMMNSSRWRRLLIDLSAAHKDSALLMYCLQTISKKGYHREISARINQSDIFGVFNAMLASELTIIGKMSAGVSVETSDENETIQKLMGDLRRMCTSDSHTYLYATELLNDLLRVSDGMDKDDLSPAIKSAVLKWGRLREELEEEMTKASTADASIDSLMIKKRQRRVDAALAVSDLRQPKKRKVSSSWSEVEPTSNNGSNGKMRQKLDEHILNFIRKHASGVKLEAFDMPDIISKESTEYDEHIGQRLIAHPPAVNALLSSLFKPGASRVRSYDVRKKISGFVAIAVIYARAVPSSTGGAAPSNTADEAFVKEKLAETILKACHLCEEVENVVSFVVKEDPSENDSSVGNQLCLLSKRSAIVAHSIMLMWATELAKGSDFVSSASYSTLSPSILGLARLISKHHPFCRPLVLDLVMIFLHHEFASSREISYQQSKALKEQCLRLLVWLIVQGQAPAVFARIAALLEGNKNAATLDAALIRYFIGGCLEVIDTTNTNPSSYSLPMMVSMARMLCAKACVDAVQSSYFEADKKLALTGIIRVFVSNGKGQHYKQISSHDRASLNKLGVMYNNK